MLYRPRNRLTWRRAAIAVATYLRWQTTNTWWLRVDLYSELTSVIRKISLYTVCGALRRHDTLRQRIVRTARRGARVNKVHAIRRLSVWKKVLGGGTRYKTRSEHLPSGVLERPN